MSGIDGAEVGSYTTERKNDKPLEVISGIDRGLIRSNPKLMRDLFTRTFSAGNITDGLGEQTSTILDRLTDLTTNFGQVEIKSGLHAGKPVEQFQAVTMLYSLGNFKSLNIKTEGFVDTADVADDDVVGNLLARPNISIKFKRRLGNGLEDFIFKFGRNNTTRFYRSFQDDDEDYAQDTELTQEQAAYFLSQFLPEIKDEDGHPSLSSGRVLIAGEGERIRSFLDGVRYGRRWRTNASPLDQRDQEKRDKYGQESVLYLPEDFFTARHGEDGFFSYDYPRSIIPEDILEHPQMEDRVRIIAEELGINVNEGIIDNMLTLLGGLPAGSSRIGFLIKKEDGSITPEPSKKVPTMIFDKAAKYLLLHPELLDDPIEKYHKMSEAVGRSRLNETAIHEGIMAGLIDGYDADARKFFGDTVKIFTVEDMRSPDAEDAIDQSYESLVKLGEVLKDEVYTADDIALARQDVDESLLK